MKRRLFVALFLGIYLTVLAIPAFGLSLDEAKRQKLIGEALTGYVQVVDPSASSETQLLAATINQRRREEYRAIAKKNGSPLEAVEKLAGQKAIAHSEPGTMVMNQDGSWVEK